MYMAILHNLLYIKDLSMMFILVRLFDYICIFVFYKNCLPLNSCDRNRNQWSFISSTTAKKEFSKSTSLYTPRTGRRGGPACSSSD